MNYHFFDELKTKATVNFGPQNNRERGKAFGCRASVTLSVTGLKDFQPFVMTPHAVRHKACLGVPRP